MGIRDWFRGVRPAEDREVREEIVFHLDRATQEYIAKGMGPEEARAEALRRFGDLEQVRRDCLAARSRGVHPVIAWSAVAALATVSFLSGYLARSGRGPSPGVDFEISTARRTYRAVEWDTSPPRPEASVVAVNWDSPEFLARWINQPRLAGPTLPASPFSAWRWRDGTPEVTLDGKEWLELVSAAGIPAAKLREEHRKAQGLPDGMYLDGNPHEMILGNKGCKRPIVEIVLRSLADGGEVKVACAGGWLRVQRVPRFQWPKKEEK